MMIMPNEESEWIHQIIRYIHSPVLFIQRGDSVDRWPDDIDRSDAAFPSVVSS